MEQKTFCIDADSLRIALREIERAEANGFKSCLAVLTLFNDGPRLLERRLGYLDLYERAHPTDGHLDWGRGQDVTRRCKFVGGKLVHLSGESSAGK